MAPKSFIWFRHDFWICSLPFLASLNLKVLTVARSFEVSVGGYVTDCNTRSSSFLIPCTKFIWYKTPATAKMPSRARRMFNFQFTLVHFSQGQNHVDAQPFAPFRKCNVASNYHIGGPSKSHDVLTETESRLWIQVYIYGQREKNSWERESKQQPFWPAA